MSRGPTLYTEGKVEDEYEHTCILNAVVLVPVWSMEDCEMGCKITGPEVPGTVVAIQDQTESVLCHQY